MKQKFEHMYVFVNAYNIYPDKKFQTILVFSRLD